MSLRLSAATLAALCLIPVSANAQCPVPGQWWQGQESVSPSALLAHAGQQDVVLLGEQHDAMEHHRWQLSTLAGLYALRNDMVIGLEMLPRHAQPVLDDWVTGALSEQELLKQTQWQEAWGFDPALYLPILHFARLHQIPLIALNITPALRQQLTEKGFDAIPAEQRHHIPAPVAASATYEARLKEVFEQHAMDTNDPQQLTRFINAQLSWDIAMAQGLAEQAQRGHLAVGLMGLGHVLYNEGVAYQLEGLGVEHTMSLLPWTLDECEPPDSDLADAVFILNPENTGSE